MDSPGPEPDNDVVEARFWDVVSEQTPEVRLRKTILIPGHYSFFQQRYLFMGKNGEFFVVRREDEETTGMVGPRQIAIEVLDSTTPSEQTALTSAAKNLKQSYVIDED